MSAQMVSLWGDVPPPPDRTPVVGRRFLDADGAERVIVRVVKTDVWHAPVLADGSFGAMTSSPRQVVEAWFAGTGVRS